MHMARRGFFAELNHQMQQADKNRRQQQAAAYRAQQAAERQAEKARRDMERAQLAASKASAKEQAEADKVAKALYQESRQADVDAMNADLANTFHQIDSMLAWTLSVDDFVDLNELRVSVEQSPFDPGPFGQPVLPLPPLEYSPQPRYVEPPASTGMFASKKKHEEAVHQAKAVHEAAYAAWHASATAQRQGYIAEQARREQTERDRVAKLAQAQAQYESDCRDREAAAMTQNADLDRFINDLAFDVESAIQDYVGIVLANSVWPDSFPVSIEHQFDLGTRELTLSATVPPPDDVPTVKEHKYVKARDEISSTNLPAKEHKERYA
jgi:restriction system protein